MSSCAAVLCVESSLIVLFKGSIDTVQTPTPLVLEQKHALPANTAVIIVVIIIIIVLVLAVIVIVIVLVLVHFHNEFSA